MRRKRIAVLISQLEEHYQRTFIEQFFSTAFEYNYDVCVFSTYRKYQESELREIGETNIFSLIDYDSFDAVVVLPDALQTPGLMVSIERDLAEHFHGKVLYVDRESDIYPYIMIDHYPAVRRVLNHLLEVHDCADVVYLTGRRWEAQSELRLQAYRDCMKEHGLPIREDRIFYGDYWYNSGADMVEELLWNREDMPQAVACANDYMAIGVAEALTKNGFRVPEDIAVVGYDSVEEGHTSPQPITSMEIPSGPFGAHAAKCVHALLTGAEMPEFTHQEPIYFGSSCGCHCESVVPRKLVRDEWATDVSAHSYFSSFNHLTEDLFSQTTFNGLMDTVQTYSYQIREFDSFHICLNDLWVRDDRPASTNIIRKGYADTIVPVLHCGPSGKGADQLDYASRFPVREMLPELNDEREEPKAFIFSPLYFDDMCFGYAVISYGSEARSYNDAYVMWLSSVMMGMECYRRMDALQRTNELAQEKEITDALTGMFNYTGFVKHSKPMVERAKAERRCVSILAMDLVGLEQINSEYGRKEGDRAICQLSEIIMSCAGEGAMCCRLGNDEFVLAELTEEANHKQIHAVRRRIDEMLERHNQQTTDGYLLQIFSGSQTSRVWTLSEMEDLVNAAVSRKNGNKASEQKMHNNSKLTPAEQESAEVVKKILNENLFTYHFQPIVSARDGSIVAYEALMRAQIEPSVSPLDIIKYATHLDRLYDVERATFFNIMKLVEDKELEFSGKKVFINSIPGSQLDGEDGDMLSAALEKHGEHVVVELTEQTEADDKALAEMKEKFSQMGVETAVDDYGTGYSNIVNLLRYMPNYVKVDRMLLSGIQDNPQKQHFVKDIVSFAHENHFQVLAEGVETTEELETVIKLDVDLIQGYYTARPNPEVLPQIAGEIQNEILRYNGEQTA